MPGCLTIIHSSLLKKPAEFGTGCKSWFRNAKLWVNNNRFPAKSEIVEEFCQESTVLVERAVGGVVKKSSAAYPPKYHLAVRLFCALLKLAKHNKQRKKKMPEFFFKILFFEVFSLIKLAYFFISA